MVGEDMVPFWGGDFKDMVKNGSSEGGYTTVGFPDYFNIHTLYERDHYWTGSEILSINLSSFISLYSYLTLTKKTYSPLGNFPVE